MVTGHQKALSLIKSSKNKIKNEEFDSVLSDIQSPVEQHLEHAKMLSGQGALPRPPPTDEPTRQGHRPAATPPAAPAVADALADTGAFADADAVKKTQR